MRPEYKAVPKPWPHSTVFIVGGGPSAKGINWERLRGKNVLATNAAAFLLPIGIAEYAVFSDKPFLRSFRAQLRGYVDSGGTLIFIPTTGRPTEETDHWIYHVQRLNGRKNWGISTDPSIVRWNRSTGGCAINIAYLLGANEIVLIGFDMKPDNGNHNWHEAYNSCYASGEKGWCAKPPASHYTASGMIKAFDPITVELEKMNVKLWNTTFGSALEKIPYKPLEEFL